MVSAYVQFPDVVVPMRLRWHHQDVYRTSDAIHLLCYRLAASSVDLKCKVFDSISGIFIEQHVYIQCL